MNEGNRIRMDRPGPDTPVPVGTWGVSLGFSEERGAWEIRWENGVNTFFPNEGGDEVSSEAPAGQAQCDFCNSKEPRWEHRCHDSRSIMVAVGGGPPMAVGQGSHGSWAACEACHRLIEAGKSDRLARRAAKRIASGSSLPASLALVGIKQAHAMYWRHRVGPGFPIRQGGAESQ